MAGPRPIDVHDWAAGVFGRPGFERWHLRVSVDANSELSRVVGACNVLTSGQTGWVDQVAVRKDYRGRGLGQALLRWAFATVRELGTTIGDLSTDSRTGTPICGGGIQRAVSGGRPAETTDPGVEQLSLMTGECLVRAIQETRFRGPLPTLGQRCTWPTVGPQTAKYSENSC